MDIKKQNIRSTASGALYLTIAVLLTKILGVMFKVPLSYILNDEGMGYFNTAYTIYGFFYVLCTAGVPKAITILVSESENNGRKAEIGETVKYSLKLFFTIGLFVSIVNLIFAPLMVKILGNNKAIFTFIAVVPSIFFVSCSGVLRGYLNSVGAFFSLAFSQLAEALCKLALGLILAHLGVHLGLSVQYISAFAVTGITIGSMVACVYLYIVTKIKISTENQKQKVCINKKVLRSKIAKISLPISFGAAVLNLAGLLDMWLMIKGVRAIGISEHDANVLYGNYSTLALPMMNLVISIITPITMIYLPILTKRSVNGEEGVFVNLTSKLIHIVAVISVLSSCSFYFYSFDILDVLFSSALSARGAELLICLSFGIVFLSVLTAVNTALEAKGKISVTVFSLLIGAAVKMILGYFLIRTVHIGVLGAPIGSVISYFVSLAISVYYLNRCGVKINILFKIFTHMLLSIIAFLPSFVIIYARGIIRTDIISLTVSLSISILIYGVMLLIWFLLCKTRESVNNAQK